MRLVLVDDVDEAGAVGEGEDVGGQSDSRKEGEEEFHGLGGWGLDDVVDFKGSLKVDVLDFVEFATLEQLKRG